MDEPLASPSSLFFLGCELLEADRHEDAITAFTRAIECDARAELSFREQVNDENAKFDPADSVYSSIKALLNRALAHKRLGNWAEAAYDFQKITDLCPEFTDHYATHAACLAVLSRHQAALGLAASADKSVLRAAELIQLRETAGPELPLSDLITKGDVFEQLTVRHASEDRDDEALAAFGHCIRALQVVWSDLAHLSADSQSAAWRVKADESAFRLHLAAAKLLGKPLDRLARRKLLGEVAVLGRSVHDDAQLQDMAFLLLQQAQGLLDDQVRDNSDEVVADAESTILVIRWYAELMLRTGLLEVAAPFFGMLKKSKDIGSASGKNYERLFDDWDAEKLQLAALPETPEWTEIESDAELTRLWNIDFIEEVSFGRDLRPSLEAIISEPSREVVADLLDHLKASTEDPTLYDLIRTAILAHRAIESGTTNKMHELGGMHALLAATRAVANAPTSVPALRIRSVHCARLAFTAMSKLQFQLEHMELDDPSHDGRRPAESTARRVRYYVEATLESLARLTRLGDNTATNDFLNQILEERFGRFYPEVFVVYAKKVEP